MTVTIDAVSVNGSLKPLTPLDLPENQPVTVQVAPTPAAVKPDPAAVTFRGIWPAEMADDLEQALAEIRAETNRKLAQLASGPMPPPETITMRGLWSHVDPDELTQALAEVRGATNRRLHQLTGVLTS